MITKLKALVVGPLKKITFFVASLDNSSGDSLHLAPLCTQLTYK